MLELRTTEQFAAWFSTLADTAAEDVATALEVIGELGPERAPPGTREALLWFEHASIAKFGLTASLSWDLEGWGEFRDYAKRVLAQLESPRFTQRLARLGAGEAERVLQAIRRIRRATDPRLRWALRHGAEPSAAAACVRLAPRSDEVRRLYFEALEAAGFAVADVPAHSRALRELSRRSPAPAYRLLYGIDPERQTALVVLGEWLDRSYYGDSVRRAERLWHAFLNGELSELEAPAFR